MKMLQKMQRRQKARKRRLTALQHTPEGWRRKKIMSWRDAMDWAIMIGKAVVPQVVACIGRAIQEAENAENGKGKKL
jgi:hypothetical protein